MAGKRYSHWEWLAAGNPKTPDHAGCPRRLFDTLKCPAELAISAAIEAVEDMGGSPQLTYCVSELGRIKDRVGDIVDYKTDRAVSFPEALQMVMTGRRMARTSWNDFGMFCFLVDGSKFTVSREPLKSILGEGTMVDYRPHIDMRDAEGKITVWTPSQADMMAWDWVQVG